MKKYGYCVSITWDRLSIQAKENFTYKYSQNTVYRLIHNKCRQYEVSYSTFGSFKSKGQLNRLR